MLLYHYYFLIYNLLFLHIFQTILIAFYYFSSFAELVKSEKNILEPGTDRSFLLCAVFVCFGGLSVLLQIGGVAPGLSMKQCMIQKMLHGLLGFAAARAYLCFGPMFLLLIPGLLFLKMTVEIPGRMLYNTPRKEGI